MYHKKALDEPDENRRDEMLQKYADQVSFLVLFFCLSRYLVVFHKKYYANFKIFFGQNGFLFSSKAVFSFVFVDFWLICDGKI